MRFSIESHCESKKVAALAVKNGRIISTGINGTPSGLTNCNEYFRNLHIVNDVKLPYDEWIKTTEWREEHHKWSNDNEIHAEQSMIAEATRNGIKLKNIDIYISLEPCINCTKLMMTLEPSRIFYVNSYDKSSNNTQKLLNNAGITIEKI